MRPPAKSLVQFQAVAVQRAQFDDANAIQLHQVLHGFRVAQAVLVGHLLQRPLAEHTNGHQQQFFVGHHCTLLFRAQFLEQGLRFGHPTCQIRKVQSHRAADRVHAAQWHVAFGQHALHAGFGHAQRHSEVGIGHAQ